MNNAIKAIVGLLLLTISQPATSIECATSTCYTDVYNSPAPSSYTQRVRAIHDRLTRTIGSLQARRSKLLIVETSGHPWAVALRDNHIVITTGAIERMYAEGDHELGDARAAFVIGHELSHLTTEDLYHHKAFVSNLQAPKKRNLLASRPDEELRADLRGYTFASIAGYRTDLLIAPESDFFRLWLSQITGDKDNATHPGNEERRQYVIDGTRSILDNVPYYKFAIALAHFGNFQDAKIILEDFLNFAETEQAYSNLGYIHIQLARQNMDNHMAYQYWIPTLLEPESGLKPLRERSVIEKEISQEALDNLRTAEYYLKTSLSMDEENFTSAINLAAAYLYMPDKLHRAYAAIEDAVRTPHGEIPAIRDQLESIYQLIRVYDDADNQDRWPKARDTLVEIATQTNSPPDNLLFNLARMLDERGRDDTATQYWRQLHHRIDKLPQAYQHQICLRLRLTCDETKYVLPWNRIDLPEGKRDIRYPEVRKYLATHWNEKPLPPKRLPTLDAQIYTDDQDNRLLALDNHLEMMIIRQVPVQYRDVQNLIDRFGTPQVYLPMPHGQLLSFAGWSAVIVDEQVLEIWVSNLID